MLVVAVASGSVGAKSVDELEAMFAQSELQATFKESILGWVRPSDCATVYVCMCERVCLLFLLLLYTPTH